MELLTNLLLNQFAGNNSATNLKADSQSDFSQYFSQASSKNTQSDSYSKNDSSKDKSYDSSSSKDSNKYDNSKKDKSSSTSETKKSDDKSTKSKDDETKVKPKDNVILIDQTMLNDIAQVLDIPVDTVLNTLADLSMSISMLEDSENLLQFVQTALGIEDSKDLLFVDDLSDMLSEITDIAQSVSFTDIGSASSIFSQFLNKEDLSNLTIIGDDIDAEALTQIKELLGELNGEIVEARVSKRELNQELLQEEMQEEALLQQQVYQNQNQNPNQVKPQHGKPMEKVEVEVKQDLSQNLKLEVNVEVEDGVDVEESENVFFNKDLKLDKNEFKQELKSSVDLNPKAEEKVLDENTLNLSSNSNMQQQSQQQSFSNDSSSSSSTQQQVSQATTTSTNETQSLSFDATFNLGGKVNNSSLVSSSQTTQGMTSNQVMAQILDKMRDNIQEDITEVKITLKPAHLGDLTLKIITEEGTITAQFLAENEKIKELIEANFDNLKDILAEKGIEVGALEVNVSDREAGQEYQTGEAFKFLQDNQVDEDLLASLLEEEEQKENAIQDDSSSVSYSA